MVQCHNRNMSFSLYIVALAITDTITLLIGGYNLKEYKKDYLFEKQFLVRPVM